MQSNTIVSIIFPRNNNNISMFWEHTDHSTHTHTPQFKMRNFIAAFHCYFKVHGSEMNKNCCSVLKPVSSQRVVNAIEIHLTGKLFLWDFFLSILSGTWKCKEWIVRQEPTLTTTSMTESPENLSMCIVWWSVYSLQRVSSSIFGWTFVWIRFCGPEQVTDIYDSIECERKQRYPAIFEDNPMDKF